jgi:hypothetical protein
VDGDNLGMSRQNRGRLTQTPRATCCDLKQVCAAQMLVGVPLGQGFRLLSSPLALLLTSKASCQFPMPPCPVTRPEGELFAIPLAAWENA